MAGKGISKDNVRRESTAWMQSRFHAKSSSGEEYGFFHNIKLQGKLILLEWQIL